MIANKFAPAVLVIICVLIIGWATLRANAAWHFYLAQSATALDESELHIGKALKRFPNNPDYLDFAGRLQVLRSSQPGVVGRERRELLESAAINFRQALLVRPLWPYSWASLLSVKDMLGQVDAEFYQAMNRAAETGPWEPAVQLQVIRSGLRYWDELRVAERELVQGKVRDALKVQPREVFDIVRAFGRPDLICGLETQQRQIARWCEDVS